MPAHSRIAQRRIHATILAVAFALIAIDPSMADDPLLKVGDRVAIVGGTFVERMQSNGALEAELQTRRPDWQLRIRNLGWSGDDVHGLARKVFDQPENGYQRLMKDLDTADPTVVIVAYGFAEASDGAPAVERFEPGLRRLVSDLKKSDRRVILVSPIALPGFRVDAYDQWISQCGQIIARVAKDAEVEALNIEWSPDPSQLTEDKLYPNKLGYSEIASGLADRLVGGSSTNADDEQLREWIVKKNELFFHRHRPQNETYLFLFRKHEQGNNAVEIPQFDPLINQADEAIWRAAKP